MINHYLLFFLIFFAIIIFPSANAHSLFNSSEQILGDFRIQIATLPEFPQIGEESQLLFRVTDLDYNEVDRFTMGVRIFFNEEQIDAIRPQTHDTHHWETEFTFQESGNHIFRVDLYDAAKDGGVLTYVFNMSTQSPFGYIFFASLIAGGMILGGVICFIYIPKIIKSRS